jgi:hypothetical protein
MATNENAAPGRRGESKIDSHSRQAKNYQTDGDASSPSSATKKKRRGSLRLFTALTLSDLRAVARFHVEASAPDFAWFTLGHIAGSFLRRFEPSRIWPECSPDAILGMNRPAAFRVFPTREDIPPHVVEALELGIAHSRNNPSTPGQDKLAELFDVDLAMRKKLRLRRVGATDLKYAERQKASDAKKRERTAARMKAKRKEQGATPRDESIAETARGLGMKPATLRARIRREKERDFGAKVQAHENVTKPVTFSCPRLSRRDSSPGNENVTRKGALNGQAQPLTKGGARLTATPLATARAVIERAGIFRLFLNAANSESNDSGMIAVGFASIPERGANPDSEETEQPRSAAKNDRATATKKNTNHARAGAGGRAQAQAREEKKQRANGMSDDSQSLAFLDDLNLYPVCARDSGSSKGGRARPRRAKRQPAVDDSLAFLDGLDFDLPCPSASEVIECLPAVRPRMERFFRDRLPELSEAELALALDAAVVNAAQRMSVGKLTANPQFWA